MPRIIAASRALPEHVVRQQQVRELVDQVFKAQTDSLSDQLQVFDHSRIETRQFVRPINWYVEPRTVSECNRIYQEEGLLLLHQAAEKCLDKAGLKAAEIDHIICVTSTGHATPSLESRLFGPLDFRPGTKRTPVWGLGCSAGAVGLSMARDYSLACPSSRVLLLALECCSLTFRREDASKKNLVGAALFADGAAATLVVGDNVSSVGPQIRASYSHLFPDTERVMGWDFDDNGMRLVLSAKLPGLIMQELKPLCERFLAASGLSTNELRHYIMHPGGARVLDAYKKALNLVHNELALSEQSLGKHGNVSSVSVLMVLEDWLATCPEQEPGFGLLAAFGPGFSAELLLLEV